MPADRPPLWRRGCKCRFGQRPCLSASGGGAAGCLSRRPDRARRRRRAWRARAAHRIRLFYVAGGADTITAWMPPCRRAGCSTRWRMISFSTTCGASIFTNWWTSAKTVWRRTRRTISVCSTLPGNRNPPPPPCTICICFCAIATPRHLPCRRTSPVTGLPAGAHTGLLQNSAGDLFLFCWAEPPVWDAVHHLELPSPAVPVAITFPGATVSAFRLRSVVDGSAGRASPWQQDRLHPGRRSAGGRSRSFVSGTASPRAAPLARSTALNFAGLVVPTLVQLVTVPLYIRHIGIDRYGVMALVWLLLGYFGVFDLGFGRAVASRIAAPHRHASRERAEIFWTGTALSVLNRCVWRAGVVSGRTALSSSPTFSPCRPACWRKPLLRCPMSRWRCRSRPASPRCPAALQGARSFRGNEPQPDHRAAFSINSCRCWWRTRFRRGCPVWCLAAICGRMVSAVMLFGYCIRHVPARGRPQASLPQARAMLGYGGWVTVTGLIYPLLTCVRPFRDRCRRRHGRGCRLYHPVQPGHPHRDVAGEFSERAVPRASPLRTRRRRRRCRGRAARLVACMMTPLLVCGLLLIPPFMTFWIGPGLSACAPRRSARYSSSACGSARSALCRSAFCRAAGGRMCRRSCMCWSWSFMRRPCSI